MQAPPPHVISLIAPLTDLPRSLDDKDSEDNEDGGNDSAENDDGAESDAGAGPSRDCNLDEDDDACLIADDIAALQNRCDISARSSVRYHHAASGLHEGAAHGSIGSREAAVTLALGQGCVVEHGAGSGKAAVCFLCRGSLSGATSSKDVMTCSLCSSRFHIECLAERWLAESEACGRTSGADAMDCAVPTRGPDRTSRGLTAGLTATSFRGLPEDGHCPCCERKHTWLDMLQVIFACHRLPYACLSPYSSVQLMAI
jgi:hypothetical protein